MTASSQAPSGEGLIGLAEVSFVLRGVECDTIGRTIAASKLAISAHLEALRAAGWKCVPVEATEAMLELGTTGIATENGKRKRRAVWRSMIAVSPNSSEGSRSTEEET